MDWRLFPCEECPDLSSYLRINQQWQPDSERTLKKMVRATFNPSNSRADHQSTSVAPLNDWRRQLFFQVSCLRWPANLSLVCAPPRDERGPICLFPAPDCASKRTDGRRLSSRKFQNRGRINRRAESSGDPEKRPPGAKQTRGRLKLAQEVTRTRLVCDEWSEKSNADH